MIVISDSDIVRKLAHCNLLNDLLNIWKIPPNTLYVLPALRAQLTKVFGWQEVAKGRLSYFFSRVNILPGASFEALDRCYGNGLDPGEQQILAVILENANVEHLISGDKRSFRQIGHLCHKDQPMRDRLEAAGLWCFESVVCEIIRRRGFATVKQNMLNWVSSGVEVDGVIAAIFTPDSETDVVMKSLGQKIGELRIDTGGLSIQF